jgi:ABC-type transporter Mla MlaB component
MIETRDKGKCSIITPDTPVCFQSNIIDCINIVKRLLNQGRRFIAFSIPDKSFFDSPCLSVLLLCYEHIRRRKGTFILINPTEEVIHFLRLTSVENDILLCPCEASLPAAVWQTEAATEEAVPA